MNKKAREHWAKLRALGFAYFILVVGAMAIGMTLAMTLLVVADWMPLPTRPHTVTRAAVLGAVIGFFFALIWWLTAENQYHRSTPPAGFEILPPAEDRKDSSVKKR